MGKPLEIENGLNTAQRSAARMELAGVRAMDIAKELSVSAATISKWRSLEAYRAHIERLHRDADRLTLNKARKARTQAIDAVMKGVRLMAKQMGEEDEHGNSALTANEAAAVTKATLDVYKTMAAQTGIKEVTKTEVSVSGPEEALAHLTAKLGGLTDEEIDAMADAE